MGNGFRPNNTIIEFDGYRFDSGLERSVYCYLRLLFKKEDISVHHSVVVKPPTNHFPERRWKCDFYIPKLNIYIEAKGIRHRTWKQQLEHLDRLNPLALDRLIVVSEVANELVFRGNRSVTIGGLTNAIAALNVQQISLNTIPLIEKGIPETFRGVSIE